MLHIFNSFEIGGVERQHMLLVRELAPFFEQACWSYCKGPIQQELNEFDIPNKVGTFSTAIAMMQKTDFDCVILRTNRYMREMADFFSRNGPPVVYIRSFLRWFEGNKTYFDPELEAMSYVFSSFVFFSAPLLQANARSLKMDLPGDEILYNGLNLSQFPLRPKPHPGDRPFRIGLLANIAPHKNQLTAINVLEQMLRECRCELVLGGASPFPDYARQVEHAAKGLPVYLTGYVSDPVHFFEGVDLALLSSTHEGWPIVLLEAMASGIPVIAPAVGDIPPLLAYGDAGVTYPPGKFDQIPDLIETFYDSEKYLNFAVAGVERVREFDIVRAGARLREVIVTVVAEQNENL